VLMWRRHLEGYAKEDFLPPVSVDVDPSNRCQYDCVFCNAYDMMHQSNEMKMLPESHFIKIADFLKDWRKDSIEGGPHSQCVAGGGEPLTNPGTMAFLERSFNNGTQSGVITNGLLLDDEKIDIVAKTCRWVGFSMDAGTSETYMKMKGIKNDKLFDFVCENIRKLTKKIDETGVNNDVAFKFLLHPDNASEIYDAAKLAKSLGMRDFHLRPVGWLNHTKVNDTTISFEGFEKIIDEQMSKALELECENFHVYGIRHKFNSDLTPKKKFSRCWAIPMIPTFGADGWVHTCFDMRGREDLKMCKHFPDPGELRKFWNSEAHKKLIREIDINSCPRCTFSIYNEAVEKVIIKDRMCHKFP